MRWLWDVAPVAALLIYLLSTLWVDPKEERRRREIRRWTEEFLGPLRRKGKKITRRVKRLPQLFSGILEAVGGGDRVSDVVLVPKLAYLAVREADHFSGSDHQTVVCLLESPAPRMVVRPLPIVDGNVATNDGIQFRKDPDFMDSFIVEGQGAKPIGKWLKRPLRRALMEMPDVWLRTEGRALALTVYGPIDAERLDELVAVADAVFAEYGEGGDPLFGEEAAPRKKAVRKAAPAPQTAGTQPRVQAAVLDVTLYAFAALAVAAVVGVFDVIHPEWMFTSPVFNVNEAWQGGWTTKGVGAFIAAELLLVGLLAYQSYLAVVSGQSIGMRLFGVRVVRVDGKPLTFRTAVLQRQWVFAAIPIAVAAVMSRPFNWRVFFGRLPTLVTIAIALGVFAALLGSALVNSERRGIHDMVAGTKVVETPAWEGFDAAQKMRIMLVTGLAAACIAINLVTRFSGTDFWH